MAQAVETLAKEVLGGMKGRNRYITFANSASYPVWLTEENYDDCIDYSSFEKEEDLDNQNPITLHLDIENMEGNNRRKRDLKIMMK